MTKSERWDAFTMAFLPRGWGWRRRQWFDAGDMKYVILRLLRDKPRHGYEVMKQLEEQLHGCYSPSPGTVYPTLQWLEDEGLVVGRDVDGKRVYEITAAGRQFLDEHQDVVDDIFARVRDAVERTVGGAMAEVNRAMGHLVKAVYRAAWSAQDDEARQRVAQVLERAAAEIVESAGPRGS
jgi:DNA-binding PadR family transcriptional regulator